MSFTKFVGIVPSFLMLSMLITMAGGSAEPRAFTAGAAYDLCFVPDGPSCQDLLINKIAQVRSRLLIQAYEFTSAPIAEAVIAAAGRGVDVRVIVDKTQATQRGASAGRLNAAGIPVTIDSAPAIAHNKIMIFDGQSVFTGSFNLTKSAQFRNSENGIVISGDPALVAAYTANWVARNQVSTPFENRGQNPAKSGNAIDKSGQQ